MSQPVKMIVEIKGGLVQAVYAPSFVECVIVDHDNPSVEEAFLEPQSNFDYMECKAYDGGLPDHWDPKMWYGESKAVQCLETAAREQLLEEREIDHVMRTDPTVRSYNQALISAMASWTKGGCKGSMINDFLLPECRKAGIDV